MNGCDSTPSVAIIGCGPAGLMAAEVLINSGINVNMYDAKPSAGRKFLVAGKGGLNITHSDPFELFISRYGNGSTDLRTHLETFGPDQLRMWLLELGFETFIGSSGKIFPTDMKAAPILRSWLIRLKNNGVSFYFNHKWTGWTPKNNLLFETKTGTEEVCCDAVIFALGGVSWPKLGSDGSWIPFFNQKGISINPFKPANCGFNVPWSNLIQTRYDGYAIKSVVLSFTDFENQTRAQKGEFLVTRYGLEGNLIYAFSAAIRDTIESQGQAEIYLDLAPDWSIQQLTEKLSKPRGSRSISSHLEKTIAFYGVKKALLWEVLKKEDMLNPRILAAAIKSLPIKLTSTRPVSEAISSAGGVRFNELDENLMLKSLPGSFCAGEMLDWEAPTGGYLLTACFSTGHAAGKGARHWLSEKNNHTKHVF